MSNDSQLRVCFLAPNAWPVLTRDTTIKAVGGAEVQLSLVAKGLAARGHNVSMVCLDFGQRDAVQVDGVTVYKAHTPDGGVPIVRFFHPRLSSVWNAMRRADADIYYQRCAGVHTGYASAFARLTGRKFVFSSASDADFDNALPLLHGFRDRQIYRWGLKHADAVVVQTDAQIESCRSSYGVAATRIASCYEPPPQMRASIDGYVLWVSTIRDCKKPERFLSLARQLPQFRFRMIGGRAGGKDAPLYAAIEHAARELGNVEFLGFVPPAEIEPHFDGARVFVNTSDWEGFPNTFLQAWARGIPTVSMFDTGSSVAGKSVVSAVRDVREMADEVERLMSDARYWRDTGVRCQQCFQREHSLGAALSSYEAVFARLLRATPEQAAGSRP